MKPSCRSTSDQHVRALWTVVDRRCLSETEEMRADLSNVDIRTPVV